MIRRALVVALCLAAAVACGQAPAQAHPFGSPQTATISTDAATHAVVVRWMPGAADDFSFLAVGLGLAPEAHEQSPDLLTVKQDVDAMDASPKLRQYLREHISVRTAAAPCPSRDVSADHLISDGATLTFDCGGADRATVDISMLTDLHPAYQTLATGDGGQRFVYRVDRTSHDWSFGAAAASQLARSAALQLSAIGGAVVALVVVGVVAVRLLRRRHANRSEAFA